MKTLSPAALGARFCLLTLSAALLLTSLAQAAPPKLVVMVTVDQLPYSQACENNKGPILHILERVLADSAQVLEIGGQSADHPVHPAIPETAYLSALFCRVNRKPILPILDELSVPADPPGDATITRWRSPLRLDGVSRP